MSDLRNSTPKALPAGVTKRSVDGKITGTYTVSPGEPQPFTLKKLFYVEAERYTYLEGGRNLEESSAEPRLLLILTTPNSIKEVGSHTISDDPNGMEAQFYLLDETGYSYGPPRGLLHVRFFTPEENNRIEGEIDFFADIFTSQGETHQLVVKVSRFDIRLGAA